MTVTCGNNRNALRVVAGVRDIVRAFRRISPDEIEIYEDREEGVSLL